MIRVIVNGAFGRMGLVTQNAINQASGLQLVGALGRQDDLAAEIKKSRAQVVVDFTLPTSVYRNTQVIIQAGAHPVIGTSGLSQQQIKTLQKDCSDRQIGGIIAPNFSLGAILMMRYAQDAAQYFPQAEIIEMHHEKKVDAPSGTAVKTAQLMVSKRTNDNSQHCTSTPEEAGKTVPIHSVRLPGLFAHQMVMFGGDGETLTLKHDSLDRHSMMPGVCLACRKVLEIKKLVYGLEKFIHHTQSHTES